MKCKAAAFGCNRAAEDWCVMEEIQDAWLCQYATTQARADSEEDEGKMQEELIEESGAMSLCFRSRTNAFFEATVHSLFQSWKWSENY